LEEVDVLDRAKNSGTGYAILEQDAPKTMPAGGVLRAVVGGALASAFIAAAFSNFIPNDIISDGAVTTAAAVVGGIVGKFYLI
jgi:hypothetical protein